MEKLHQTPSSDPNESGQIDQLRYFGQGTDAPSEQAAPRWNQMFRAPREMSVFADGIVCVP